MFTVCRVVILDMVHRMYNGEFRYSTLCTLVTLNTVHCVYGDDDGGGGGTLDLAQCVCCVQ